MNKPNRAMRPIINKKICNLSLGGSVVAMLIFSLALLLSLMGSIESVPTMTDTTPPIISGAVDLKIYIGESPAYRKNISLSDDSGEEVILSVDTSSVQLTEPGRYPVIYTATDSSGNQTSVIVYLTIEVYFPKEQELQSAIERVVSQIITANMNTEEKIRAVYKYVQNNIVFVDSSDKTNWKAEAYRALFVTNTGDCFSFFAASKAFFEYLGIENLDIQRPEAIAAQMQQTHYWSMVNISDDPSKEIWYHYDSCRLRAEYNHSGCLLTEVQINAYNFVRENFYAYDSSKYPVVCDAIITPTPELEEFYNKN